jgi:hypothetical protein
MRASKEKSINQFGEVVNQQHKYTYWCSEVGKWPKPFESARWPPASTWDCTPAHKVVDRNRPLGGKTEKASRNGGWEANNTGPHTNTALLQW